MIFSVLECPVIKEVWKGVIYAGTDYSWRLEVSDNARLRNTNNGHIYKTTVNNTTGYEGVCISFGSRDNKKLIRLHKAIAESFIDNPYKLPCINHIDGVKTNNSVENLEWVTYKDNAIHAFETGLAKVPTGLEGRSSKLLPMEVFYIKSVYKPRDNNFGARALARKFDLCHSTILKIVNNTIWVM